ncbi:MAG: 50S ribosomal protein L30 [Candidatus Nanohalarchaeota archaeon]|nr:MAG: 50S ribosomal protein L30 [Candidatus Nanohaloarchaeota archaeon]
MYCVIRIRGTIGVDFKIKYTLGNLRLNKPNHCIIVPENEYFLGMLKKAKDFIAYGTIDEEFAKQIDKKRKCETPDKTIKLYRLCPPRKGFERGGIRLGFNQKGALGNRGEKIKELVEKML